MEKLSISFSGGRSSAMMTKMCLEKHKDTHEIVVTFANTGCEHPATLDFVRDCDLHWGFNTVWLEAVVGPDGVGIRHKIVSWETASRNGEPFEAVIKKYGIPNMSYPLCTSRLKSHVMESYLKSLGWDSRLGKRNYQTAIGIRADEIDRMSASADKYRFIYPLVDAGMTKDRVNAEMRRYPWDLKLPNDAFGNCMWCWKKSIRKLLTVASTDPSAFDFPVRMEAQYSLVKAPCQPIYKRAKIQRKHFYKTVKMLKKRPRFFFRERRTAQDILRLSKEPFALYEDTTQRTIWDEFLDMGGSCSDGCEIGHD